jgi:hypothetical protein
MFGSNSPQYSERALDHRVRLAHPDSQIQLSNSFEIIRCRVERQPSIVTLLTNAVKPISNFRPVYFRPTGPRTKTPIPQGFVSPRHSRRVCIVTDPNIGGNPQPCNSIARQRAVTSTDQQRPRNHHSRGPPPTGSRSTHSTADKRRFHPLLPTTRNRWSKPTDQPLSKPSALHHGPCRNRTYNLAIKSRLLCQLS